MIKKKTKPLICKRPNCNEKLIQIRNGLRFYCTKKCNRIDYEDNHPEYVVRMIIYQKDYQKIYRLTHKKKRGP